MSDKLGKCCHTCTNCTSDEEEYLICIYDNELKDFDDVCDKWELDEDMRDWYDAELYRL